MSTRNASANEALTPVGADQRVFQWHDHASLWFSLGVGLLVMQVGAYLMPALGTQEALLAIVAGSILGAGLLGWVAKIGCDSGLASAGLMHAVYGRQFARLPIVLNIIQLIGWGTFELVVMRDASVAIGRQGGGWEGAHWPVLATLLWGGVVMLLISGSMVQLVRKLIARVALPLVVLSLLWLSWQFVSLAQAQGLSALWNRQGAGGMGVLPALDLVIAMPISWLPLVADYARHGKSGGAALRDTWLLCLPQERFQHLYATSLGFNQFLVQHLNMRLGQAMTIIEAGRTQSPEHRVALYLSRLFWRRTRQLYVTQEELGKLVGVSRQTVNRVLRDLAARGIISLDHGRVLICCDAALGRYLASAEDKPDTASPPPTD